MSSPNDSLFRSAIRAFLVAAFGITGLFFGLIPASLIIGLAGQSDGKVQPKTGYEVSPNVDGARSDLQADSSLILRIDIEGFIGSEVLNADQIERVLLESQGPLFDEGRVKGIFLVINTMGGTVFDSDNIYRYIKEYKKKHNIPVVAFVNGLCASGGMYIASSADQIYASDVSLVGSVGVIFSTFFNFTKLLEDYGVESKTVSAGKGKDSMNPFRSWTADDGQDIEDLTKHFYAQFVDIVTENRPRLDKNKLITEYGARLFPAQQAAENGYLDGYGYNYFSALNVLVQAAELGGEDYQVVRVTSKNWWSDLVSGSLSLFNGKVTHEVQVTPGVSSEFANQFLYYYQP